MFKGQYKRKDLVDLIEKFRNKQGNRTEYLAYGFLRGVPYREIEKITQQDKDPYWTKYPNALNCIIQWPYVARFLCHRFWGKIPFDLSNDEREKFMTLTNEIHNWFGYPYG